MNSLKPWLAPRYGSVLGFALATSTQEHGASVGREEAPLPLSGGEGGPSLPWLSRAHWYHPPPKNWLGLLPTVPPMVRPEAAQPLARGEQAGGTSLSHWEQPPWHGMGLVPALLSTDELRTAQGVFRNQNRMFPCWQPAVQGYQPELASPPPSPAQPSYECSHLGIVF